jgi:glycosyltransferase involved in cell wall biosynthesis
MQMSQQEEKPVASADGHFVSVVIPTIGRGTLDRTLEALRRQSRPPDAVEVVVDDDRRGASWARNEGIRRAKGDLVAFTDDDAVPPDDWLERLIDAVDRHGADGAGGTQRETDPLLADKNRRHAFPEVEGIDDRGAVCDTANLVYRRALLDATAARDGFVFDVRFPSAEDTELAWRLRRRGARLVYVPNRVVHLRTASPRVYLGQQYRRGQGIGMLYLAHREVGGPHQAGKSRIWGDAGRSRLKWFRSLLHKGIGPFDVGSFHSASAFLLFWAGAKLEALGFLAAVARNRRTFRPAADGPGDDR